MTVLGHARPPTIPMVFTASSELTLVTGTGGHCPGSLQPGISAQSAQNEPRTPQVNAMGWPTVHDREPRHPASRTASRPRPGSIPGNPPRRVTGVVIGDLASRDERRADQPAFMHSHHGTGT